MIFQGSVLLVNELKLSALLLNYKCLMWSCKVYVTLVLSPIVLLQPPQHLRRYSPQYRQDILLQRTYSEGSGVYVSLMPVHITVNTRDVYVLKLISLHLFLFSAYIIIIMFISCDLRLRNRRRAKQVEPWIEERSVRCLDLLTDRGRINCSKILEKLLEFWSSKLPKLHSRTSLLLYQMLELNVNSKSAHGESTLP